MSPRNARRPRPYMLVWAGAAIAIAAIVIYPHAFSPVLKGQNSPHQSRVTPTPPRATGTLPESKVLTITATAKGPNQINLTWPPVASPGYGYLVEIQSDGDSRYTSWTELDPMPTAGGFTCDP